MTRRRQLVAVLLLLAPLALPGSAAARCTASACTAAVDLPLELPFTGDRGGIRDGAGIGTGFTLVDEPTAGAGLLPDRLSVGEGLLRVTTTAGIAFLEENSQDNALGVALPADDRAVILETSLVLPPAGSGSFEQAGLWYGTSEDDYVKLVLISRIGLQVHMLHEGGGLRRASVYTPPLPSAPAEIALRLRIDRAADRITGAFEVEGGPALPVARWAVPAGLDEPQPGGAISRGGIFATDRFGPATLAFAFDRFEARCASASCAPGPAPHDPDNGDGETPIGVPEEPDGDGGTQPPARPPDKVSPPPRTVTPPPAPRGGPVPPSPPGSPAGGEAARHTVSLSVRSRLRRRALLRRGLRAKVRCSEACRVKVALLAGRRVVGRGAGTARGRIVIAPTRRAARRLRGVRRLRVRVRAAFADGSRVTARRTVALTGFPAGR